MKSQKVKNAETLVADLYKRIPLPCKWSFFSTVIMSVIVYFPVYSLRLEGPDGIIADVLSTWQWDFQLGRWMLAVDVFARNKLTLSYYIFVTTFIALGIISALLCRIFSIKGKLNATIVGLLVATFPSVSNSMQLFNYVPSYFISSLLAILGVYIAFNYSGAFFVVVSAVLLCIGMGYYQSCLPVAMALCILLLIKTIGFSKSSFKEVKGLFARLFMMGSTGLLLYLLTTKILSWVTHIPLVNYSGTDQITSISVLLSLLQKTYKTTFSFYFSRAFNNNSDWHFTYFYFPILLVGLIVLVLLLIKKRKQFGIFKLLAIVCLGALLPIALDAVEIMMPTKDVKNYLTFPMLFPLLGCIFLVQEYSESLEQLTLKYAVPLFIVLLGSLGLINSYWQYDTAIYLAMEQTQNKAEALAIRIVYSMEQTEGYVPGMKIMICGTENSDSYPKIYSHLYEATNQSASAFNIMWPTLNTEQMEWISILQSTCGNSYQETYEEDFKNILSRNEYKNMPVYPNKSSIRVIDGIMVVKLTNDYNDLYTP